MLDKKPFTKTLWEKGENQHFLLFPQHFLPFMNSLPDDKILEQSKSTQIADDILKYI